MKTKNIPSQRWPKEIVMADVGQQTLADTNIKIVSTSVSQKNLTNVDQKIVSTDVGKNKINDQHPPKKPLLISATKTLTNVGQKLVTVDAD